MLPTLKLKFHLAHILGDSASRLHERPAGLPTDNALTAPHALVPALGARAGAWLLGPGWRLLWGLTALVAVLPLLLTEFPPLYDYFHWLYTGHLVTGLLFGVRNGPAAAVAYTLLPVPIPNLAAPVGIGLLGGIFPRELSGSLFLAGCVLVAAFGFAFLVRSIQGQRTVAEWLGWPWAYGYFLAKGYLSYLLAVGLLCIAVGVLHRSTAGATRRPSWRVLGLLAGFSVGLYLAHLMAWAVFMGVCGVYGLLLLRRGLGRAALAVGGTLLPALGLFGWYLLSPRGATTLLFYPAAPEEKLLALVAPWQLFLRADPFPSLVPVFWANLVGLAVLGALWLMLLGRPRLVPEARPLLVISALLLVGAVLMPIYQISDLIRPDERLILPAILFALAACRYRPFDARRALLVVSAMVLLLGLHGVEYQRAGAAMEAIDDATTAVLPRRASVLALTVYEWEAGGACQREPLSWSLGAPTLKWFALDRLAETRRQRTNLMETSLVIPRFDPTADGADLLVEQMTAEEVRAAPLGPRYAATYPYVEVFGCPADLQTAQQAFAPQYAPVTTGAYFTVLHRQP
jgi:hypothetical protein